MSLKTMIVTVITAAFVSAFACYAVMQLRLENQAAAHRLAVSQLRADHRGQTHR